MAQSSRPLPIILALVVVIGAFIAAGLTIGFAPTLTLTAIAMTVLVFYLLLQTTVG